MTLIGSTLAPNGVFRVLNSAKPIAAESGATTWASGIRRMSGLLHVDYCIVSKELECGIS